MQLRQQPDILQVMPYGAPAIQARKSLPHQANGIDRLTDLPQCPTEKDFSVGTPIWERIMVGKRNYRGRVIPGCYRILQEVRQLCPRTCTDLDRCVDMR